MSYNNIGSDYIQYAKDIAKAEKELMIEPRIIINLCYRNNDKLEILYTYDIKRKDRERWAWVINWRRAKLICENPRRHIITTESHYDKNSGLDYGFNSCLYRLISLKGQIAKQEKNIQEYIKANADNMFFDEKNDPKLLKIQAKLEQKKANVTIAENILKEKVIEYQKQKNQ